MRRYILIIICSLYTVFVHAQDNRLDSVQLSLINLPQLDSMERLLAASKAEDTARVILLGRLSFAYAFNQADKAVVYGQQGIKISRQLGYSRGVAYCSQSLAMGLWGVGNYSNALEAGLLALHIFENLGDQQNIAFTYYVLANIYRDFGDYKRALSDAQKGFRIYKEMGMQSLIGHALIGSIYELQNRLDSASSYIRTALQIDQKINKATWGWLYYLQGNIHRKMKQYDSAMVYYRTALPLVDYKDIVETFNGIAILYKETGRIDSSIFYATEVVQNWSFVSYQRGILQATNILADTYKRLNQRDSVIKYLELSVALNNRMFNQENERNVQNLAFKEQLRQDEILRERAQNQTRLRMYGLVTGLIVFLMITILLWRSIRQKQKAKEKIEIAYEKLKATQAQLIQSEKMASLGQLAAGIAHEIQNPLNFVNNFSEVNKELIDEMESERSSRLLSGVNGEKDAILETELLNDIKHNTDKIIHHGKRAESIVTGMLQHCRTSTGQKEPTDINKLTDEYLRLSHNSFTAKENAPHFVPVPIRIKTDFDYTAGNIDIIPQDIGRVLLNVYNNAFYAVQEKAKLGIPGYEPTVSVSTKKEKDTPGTFRIIISVKDNGIGIPQKIADKIFQPFFTTKPTGEGTGLGLSLSYDIIKAHGGELKLKTMEGEGCEFTIHLPFVE